MVKLLVAAIFVFVMGYSAYAQRQPTCITDCNKYGQCFTTCY